MEEIVVGIDVGTTKVCTLVGRVEDNKSIRILGVGGGRLRFGADFGHSISGDKAQVYEHVD